MTEKTIRILFIFRHLVFFLHYLGGQSYERDKRFHQHMTNMEKDMISISGNM